MSSPRLAPGGAPQGTKSGNILFTLTIDNIEKEELARPRTTTRRTTPPIDLMRTYDQDDSFNLQAVDVRTKRGTMRVESSEDSASEAEVWTQSQVSQERGVPPRWEERPPWIMKFVDDVTTGSRSLIMDGRSHIGTHKEKREIHAEDLEDLFYTIRENSEKVGMSINEKKTQLLCMNQAVNYEVSAFVRIDGEEVKSGESLKILGFKLGRRGDMGEQVKAMKRRFAASVWIVRHLKGAGIDNQKITAVYCSMIRAQIEYAAVVYGPLLTAVQSAAVERLQAMALRTIWGWGKSYRECLEISGLEWLSVRRHRALCAFARKTSANPRYQYWFPPNDQHDHDLRRTERYKIRFAKHERLKNTPIYAMRRILNDEDDTINDQERREPDLVDEESCE